MSTAQAERLEALLKSRSAADRAEVRSALSRLASEMKERGKRTSSASFDYFVNALRLLSRIKGTSDADIRLDCLADCVSYFYHSGHAEKALRSANQLLALATLSRDDHWISKGHFNLAAMLADAGDVGEALVHHSRAIDISRRSGNIEFEACALLNTGVALNYAGLYGEAIPCFRRSEELVASLPGDFDQVRVRSFANLAQSYLYLGQFREGFVAAERAVDASPEPIDAASTVSYAVRCLTFVQLALELGKLRSARERANASVQFALRFGSPRAQALAETARGLCEVHGGDTERGLQVLENALAASNVHSLRPIILVALVKAYDVVNQPERALHHMKGLLAHVRSLREKALETALGGRSWNTDRNLQALEVREARLEARIAEHALIAERQSMFERLAVTADLKEEESGEHGYRVGKLAALIAESMTWNREVSQALESAARLHDIGKVAIPDRILLSAQSLQEAERQFMAMHTTIGAELLGKGNSPQLRMAEEIARHHHEWWNGEGYPSKLKGKRIPIHARIVAIADVFDALTHGRPYSPAWPIDKAIDEIKSRKGTQFDPEITEVFLELIAKLRAEHADLDEYLGRAGRNSPFLQARNRIREMLADGRENEKTATMEGNQTRH